MELSVLSSQNEHVSFCLPLELLDQILAMLTRRKLDIQSDPFFKRGDDFIATDYCAQSIMVLSLVCKTFCKVVRLGIREIDESFLTLKHLRQPINQDLKKLFSFKNQLHQLISGPSLRGFSFSQTTVDHIVPSLSDVIERTEKEIEKLFQLNASCLMKFIDKFPNIQMATLPDPPGKHTELGLDNHLELLNLILANPKITNVNSTNWLPSLKCNSNTTHLNLSIDHSLDTESLPTFWSVQHLILQMFQYHTNFGNYSPSDLIASGFTLPTYFPNLKTLEIQVYTNNLKEFGPQDFFDLVTTPSGRFVEREQAFKESLCDCLKKVSINYMHNPDPVKVVCDKDPWKQKLLIPIVLSHNLSKEKPKRKILEPTGKEGSLAKALRLAKEQRSGH
jgi:hypothetical protein